MSILSHRGYSISKKTISPENLAIHRKALTIMPFVEREEYAHLAQPIKMYQETDQRLYMPRFYAIQHIGPPSIDKVTTKNYERSKRLKFSGEMRARQVPVVKAAIKALDTLGGGVISIGCGEGKCHSFDTPILMYSGEIKKVQDIVVGDQLMGDDSTPRNVLSLARGREMMYDIVPNKGDTYTVNESHILSLKCSVDCRFGRKGTIVDIPLLKYLALPKSFHGRAGKLLGCRTGVEFEEQEVPMDPYFLGLWLGNGSSSGAKITTADYEILNYVKKIADLHNHVVIQEPNDPISYQLKNPDNVYPMKGICNYFTSTLRSLNVLNNKHVPDVYKHNSREVRMQVLAGLLDTDGFLSNNGYDFIQKRERLLNDVVFIARSLGFSAYVQKCTNAPGGPKSGTYYRTYIHGPGLEDLPILLPRKKARPRKQIKNVLSTRIKVVKKDVDDYYGFMIDGNHRYLLGDFTITHNTSISIYCACEKGLPTGVVCNTTSMMKQWHERIRQFAPDAKIGIVQRDRTEVEGMDFVIMSVKTLAMREYPKETFERLGMCIWDEVHLYPTTLFSLAFPKLTTKYSLGLSATPFRKDKCEEVIYNFIGPICYFKKRDRDTNIEARCVSLMMEDIEAPTNKYGKIMYTSMAVATVKRPERTEFLSRLLCELTKTDRTILVLGEYVEHLKALEKRLTKMLPQKPMEYDQKIAWLMGGNKRLGANSHIRRLPPDLRRHIVENYFFRDATVGLYIGAMKCDQRKVSEGKDVILGTYKLASVGMDISTLNTLLFASPRKDIEQSVGRILRKQSGEGLKPLIIDIIDNHGVFQSQGRVRKQFYKQYGYTIIHEKMLPDGTVLSKRTVKSTDEADDPAQCEVINDCLFD